MKTKYNLTEEGLERIKKELNNLKEKRKEETRGEIPDVLQSEDLNPEYLDFRQKIEFLEKRIAKLEEVVKKATIIKEPEDKSKVQLGAKVTIEADGQKDEFMIVGSLEADPSEGKISDQSLVGKKLLGKEVGDKAKVSSRVETIYKIKKIEY